MKLHFVFICSGKRAGIKAEWAKINSIKAKLPEQNPSVSVTVSHI